jgi:hypothetical protein
MVMALAPRFSVPIDVSTLSLVQYCVGCMASFPSDDVAQKITI